MSYGSGSLTISARRSGRRTVLERVHYDGISRCSRALAHGDAALVMVSQLGPGVVRGDDLRTTGDLAPGAHLIVTSQTATRLLGGSRAARSVAHWSVADGAVLEIVGEPLVAAADARYTGVISIRLGARAAAIVSELAAVPRGAEVRLRTTIVRDGREVLYDAFDAGAAAPRCVGTFAVAGLCDARAAALTVALDTAADTFGADVHCGVGALGSGAFARLLADDIWPVRAALQCLRDAARAVLVPSGTFAIVPQR